MSDWAEGYVKGVDYTYDYYRELNPLAANLALLRAGFAPDRSTVGASCELGFGFGVSTTVHAAGSRNEWWGTDFNPSQAAFARELGQSIGDSVHLFDQSFSDFCQRTDLPEFDFIGLHGVWSWVSDENRRLIVDFVRRRLRLGGVLYVSYNTQPGWAQMVPLRQLLMEHAETLSPPGASVATRIDAALEYVDALLDTSPGFAAVHPAAVSRIKSLKAHGRNYLAHEYFNRDWQPMLFSEFARWLEPAKVNFACSALYSDHFDVFNLLPAQTDILNQIPNVPFQESARDFVINRQFRKDYWIKGPRRLSSGERNDALRAHRVVLLSDPTDIVLKAGGSLMERELHGATYQPLIELLADHQVHALGELEESMQKRGIPFEELLEATMVLIGKGDAASAQEEGLIEKASQTAARFNRHVIESSARVARVSTLASPVTGGGISVQSFHLQMLLARQQGLDTPKKWAGAIQQALAANGAGIVKPGGGLMSAEESLAALTKEGKAFAAKVLPRLQALRVVD